MKLVYLVGGEVPWVVRNDVGKVEATFLRKEHAETFMRWIMPNATHGTPTYPTEEKDG